MEKCSICRGEPNPACDWRQGRCPHRESVMKFGLSDIARVLSLVILVFCALNVAVHWNETPTIYAWIIALTGWLEVARRDWI